MRLSDVFSASAIFSLAAAHGNAGIPRIFGLPPNDAAALRGRAALGPRRVAHSHGPQLAARQGGNAQGRCGKAFGCATCAAGYCCSPEGYCGQGKDYCQAPDSQFEYGPGADANQVPPGGSTRNTPRPKTGSVLYGGEGIWVCEKPGQIAITYDDGPYEYTPHVLDLFAAKGFKATFFVTGINLSKGRLDDSSKGWAAMINRMISEGHQVASHTWSHQDLSAITKEQRYDQMVRLEMAVANIIGKFPTYMRPPYSSCTAASGCVKDMEDLGYHISYFDLDTDDYNNITPELQQNAKNRFAAQVNPSNPATDEFLAIAHDIHYQTAYNLTSYMLDLMVQKGYVGVTMGECLGDPQANWYRTPAARVASTSSFSQPACASTSSAASRSSATGSRTSSGVAATPTTVSPDASCGSASGFTCTGFTVDGVANECCSQYNFCGNTEGHCGTGCQAGFGKCGNQVSSSSAASSAASASASGSASASSRASVSSTSSGPSATPSVTSPDSSCGATSGFTCTGFVVDGVPNECCSQYNYCGNTEGHCGTGCQAGFGKCGTSSSSSAASSVASSSVRQSASSSPVSSSASRVSSSASSSAPSSSVRSSSVVSSAASSSVRASGSATSSSVRSSSSSAARSSSAASSSIRASSTPASSSVRPSSSSVRPSSSSLRPSSTPVSSRASSTLSRAVSSSSSTLPSSSVISSSRTSSAATPSPTIKQTTNGLCGRLGGGTSCIGYRGGECCSKFGYCDNGFFACFSSNCDKAFGKCW